VPEHQRVVVHRAPARRLAATLLLAATIAASTSAIDAAGPLTLTIGVPGAPLPSLDITSADNAVAREVWRLQYPALTSYALATLDVVPGLASSWRPSPDRREWTYTLRPDAMWSDGVPVHADDVVFSIERARDERWPYAVGLLDGVQAAAADDRTVVVRVPEPGALPSLPIHVVPRRLFEAGTDVGTDGTVVGAGDWHVVERREDAVRLQVVERPGRPAIDEIVVRAYPTAAALVAAVSRGEVDVAAALPPETYEEVRALDGVQAIHANDGDQWLLRVRRDDPDLRRLLARAFDRIRLVHEVAGDVGRPATVPVVARSSQWQLESDDRRALEADLAFTPGTQEQLGALGIRTLTMHVADERASEKEAAFVRATLDAAGITVELAPEDRADLVLVRRNPSDDPVAALEPYTCAGDIRCDPEFDASFVRARDGDFATRRDAVRSMITRLATEGVEVVLYAPDDLQAYRSDNIGGLLRELEEERLVVLWPSTAGYAQAVRAEIPGGEEIPDLAFALIAGGITLTTVLALAVGPVLIRRSKGSA
jgi:peptide/nickel transport system substrate-binding protein